MEAAGASRPWHRADTRADTARPHRALTEGGNEGDHQPDARHPKVGRQANGRAGQRQASHFCGLKMDDANLRPAFLAAPICRR
jgi:hypothetical protein